MSKVVYCVQGRKLNREQQLMSLEIIQQIHPAESDPLHLIFTEAAGCGKPYTLKIVMDDHNRLCQQQNFIHVTHTRTLSVPP